MAGRPRLPGNGLPPAAEEVEKRHEDGGPYDRPEDREGLAGRVEHEGLRELHLARDPGAEQRADETQDDGDEESAPGPATEGAADGAADRGDEEEKEEAWYRNHVHFSSTGERDEIRFG